ncbi:DUF2812 domain-containing protein [Paenibacillus sp. J2TS4]|uniref:DUF2812 domain-containing protein n=1 Tax=Paenibacillus sp. J2TS4 TaxID=2807194 RepID=UPI001B217D03|nr:DUF2812 domain-containing protein [Paenibacillus sp. J2TS4]GIP36290.1 hypothetical protein J2TS4_55000 [Paenibacillus sp. J2TS4]
MARTKYMMSSGLAFSEKKDMEKLRQKALKGWHLKKFRFAGYELEKGEREDIIYSIDYRALQPNEEEEYFEMFSHAGWTNVCSSQDMHIFKAKKGTKPIYSDVESARDKLERLANPIKSLVAFLVGMTAILWIMMTFTSGLVQNISQWTFLFSFVLTIPAIMTYMATYYHKWKKRIDK